jgi:hypothetical protein
MQDTSPADESQSAGAAAPEVAPVAPPDERAPSEPATSTWAALDGPVTDLDPVPQAPVPPVEEPAPQADESLVERVQALERKVASLEAEVPSAPTPEEPARSGLYSPWTLIALTLLMLISVAAAIVAIARAHRARSELSRLVPSPAE